MGTSDRTRNLIMCGCGCIADVDVLISDGAIAREHRCPSELHPSSTSCHLGRSPTPLPCPVSPPRRSGACAVKTGPPHRPARRRGWRHYDGRARGDRVGRASSAHRAHACLCHPPSSFGPASQGRPPAANVGIVSQFRPSAG
jgi:hypothetical protein